jgi:phage gp36-like protein
MAFIFKTDLTRYLEADTIDQLTDSTDTIVEEAIKDAEERIKEKISPRFNMVTEFAKTGTDRHRSLMKCCINLSIFYLFQRVHIDVLPEGRENAYEEAETWLNDVYKGKLNVDLATVDETKEKGWPLRWGSQTKKGNQSY